MNTRRRRTARTATALTLLAATVTLTATTRHADASPAAYVQTAANVTRTGSQVKVHLPAPSQAGDLLVVTVNYDNAGGTTITDGVADSFKPTAGRTGWQNGSLVSKYSIVKGRAQNVTVTFTQPITRFGQVYVTEYAGVDQTAPYDGSRAQAGSGQAMSTPPVSTTANNDLIVGAGASSAVVNAAGAGYVLRNTSYGNVVEDAVAGPPGQYAASASHSGAFYVMQTLAFRSADTSGTTTTTIQPTTTTTQPATTSTTATTQPTTTTMPGGMPADQCALATFCDAFQTINAGGRGGDLDESKWSFSRLSQETVPSQGSVNKYVPFDAEFCTTTQTRQADADSFVCGQQFGESNHWMEGFYDNGSYVNDAARILQPFDFAGRLGTLDFSVDAKSTGSHGSWTETWLTDQPVNSPHGDHPGTHAYPRNGVAVIYDMPEACGGTTSQTANSIREVDVFTNYVERVYPVPGSCFTTQDDRANHVQVKVSTTGVQVYVSDHASDMMVMPPPVLRASVSFDAPLSWSRGYWSLEHAQYNASKAIEPCECGQNTFTYHWHAASFDGPAVPVDRSYQVPDSLMATCGGNNNVCGVNLGYTNGCWSGLPVCSSWTIGGVDTTGASAAYLTYDAHYACCTFHGGTVTVNGHVFDAPDPNPDAATSQLDAWRYVVLPIPLADLQASNDVHWGSDCNGGCGSVANVDLELVP